ncbi:glycine receptor subunit alphaZ1-like [Ptychodera flava]|uniref:glycine receptor subunit alphaZ1-like n=1 Tax=Ptychodera flava TaxID=63121 RepID=UPI00396A4326
MVHVQPLSYSITEVLGTFPKGDINSDISIRFTLISKRSDIPPGEHYPYSKLLTGLFTTYDMRLRPNFDGPPVKVECDIYVSSFDSISETTMDYVASLYLRQRWNDSRLTFDHNTSITLNVVKSLSEIWIPDIFFTNEKEGRFHHVTVDNKLLRIWPHGEVLYGIRLTLRLSCPMNFHRYPMDRQICRMKMQSYGYTKKDIMFSWKKEDPITLNAELKLPEFVIRDVRAGECTGDLEEDFFFFTTCTFTESYSCIQTIFMLHRQMAYHLLQSYIPTSLLVILSWVSFWINVEAAPARVSLCITTVLTMATQSSGVQASLPRVSYIKAIDIWMSVCLIFVFAALLEFAAVNFVLMEGTFQLRRQATQRRRRNIANERKNVRLSRNSNRGGAAGDQSRERRRRSTNTTLTAIERCLAEFSNAGLGDSQLASYEEILTDQLAKAKRIDRVARIAFPMAFIAFNMLYWVGYLTF